MDVLDVFSDFVDRIADEEVEVRLPRMSGHATPIDDRPTYIEYAHDIRQILLPTSDTILIGLRIQQPGAALSC